jgi:hypothetical protein
MSCLKSSPVLTVYRQLAHLYHTPSADDDNLSCVTDTYSVRQGNASNVTTYAYYTGYVYNCTSIKHLQSIWPIPAAARSKA